MAKKQVILSPNEKQLKALKGIAEALNETKLSGTLRWMINWMSHLKDVVESGGAIFMAKEKNGEMEFRELDIFPALKKKED